jgi:hypothetical protein
MIRKPLNARVKSIERKLKNPAERTAFLKPAPFVVVAHYAGNLQPNEKDPWKAFKRALGYPDSDLYGLYDDLRLHRDTELKRRYDKALRPVFKTLGYDYFPHEKWQEGITKLEEQLPPEWREWIQREEYEAELDFPTLRRVINARYGRVFA